MFEYFATFPSFHAFHSQISTPLSAGFSYRNNNVKSMIQMFAKQVG
jgi:hypothetical protein